MPDLNSLLRWSIANSASQTDDSTDADQSALSLRFRPAGTHASQPSAATLHPSDPYYRRAGTPQAIMDDISPASTPGPATPLAGETLLPSTTSGGPATSAPRSDLTTEMLDLIMGKSDSLTMKEKMDVAMDTTKELDERVEALDDFEMLIELIDNANNMAILKLWEPLLALLSSEDDEIVRHAAWIAGTAVQNNLKAQAALYIHNIFPRILSLIYANPSSSESSSSTTDAVTPSTSEAASTATRAKATYALSSALKHWPLAAAALAASSGRGYKTLQRGLSDPENVVRRKMAFLVGTLVAQAGEVYEGELPNEVRALVEAAEGGEAAASASGPSSATDNALTPGERLLSGLKSHGIFTSLLDELKRTGASGNGGGVSGTEGVDEEFEENAIRALVRAVEVGGLTPDEKEDLKAVWTKWGAEGREARGLGGEDGVEVGRVLGA